LPAYWDEESRKGEAVGMLEGMPDVAAHRIIAKNLKNKMEEKSKNLQPVCLNDILNQYYNELGKVKWDPSSTSKAMVSEREPFFKYLDQAVAWPKEVSPTQMPAETWPSRPSGIKSIEGKLPGPKGRGAILALAAAPNQGLARGRGSGMASILPLLKKNNNK
jgi:hypothetical protein